jgi:nitrosocyanin
MPAGVRCGIRIRTDQVASQNLLIVIEFTQCEWIPLSKERFSVISKTSVARAFGGLALSLALAACTSGAGTPANPGVSLNVVGLDTFKYEPPTLTANVGQTVTVNLENKGNLDHSFVIDELNVKLETVKAGTTQSVSFTPGAAGTYTFYCDVPGHQAAGMTGTLTVAP